MWEDDGQMDFAEGAALGGGLGLGAAALGMTPVGRKGIRAAANWGKEGAEGSLRAGMGKWGGELDDFAGEMADGARAMGQSMSGGIKRQLGNRGTIAPQDIKANPFARAEKLVQEQQVAPQFAQNLKIYTDKFAKGDPEGLAGLKVLSQEAGDEGKALISEAVEWARRAKVQRDFAGGAGAAAGAGAGVVGGGAAFADGGPVGAM